MSSSIPWKLTFVGLVLAVVARNLLDTLRPLKKSLPTNDSSKCTLLEGPTGAEDMVLTSDGKWIITSSVDSGQFFDHGINGCDPSNRNVGGLWTLQAKSDARPTRMAIEEFDEPTPCFMTHGLYLSDKSNRLYAVTHHGNYSSIEIFDMDYNPDNAKNTSSMKRSSSEPSTQPPTLTWVRSVTSDSFLNVGPNDVVEGSHEGELYVTQFLPFSIPPTGRFHPISLVEKVQQALLLPIFFLGIKLSTVLRCTFVDDDPNIPAECTIATRPSSTRFRGANGIAISDDRTRVFVNDVMSYIIYEFQRNVVTGMLEQVDAIPLNHAADNIEWKRNVRTNKEEVWMGTIPDLVTVATNENKPYEERAAPVPGGLAVVTKDDNNGDDSSNDNHGASWGEQHVVYNHDGSMLSQISFGMQLEEINNDSLVFVGSAYSKGILVCNKA